MEDVPARGVLMFILHDAFGKVRGGKFPNEGTKLLEKLNIRRLKGPILHPTLPLAEIFVELQFMPACS